jgi:hypothetical protein
MSRNKQLKKILRKIWDCYSEIDKLSLLVIFLLVLISLIVLMPLVKAQFNWLDDGWDLMMAKNLINYTLHLNLRGILDLVIETTNGRFRPGYWLWQSFVYLFSGNSAEIQYLFHSFLIFSIILLIYKIVYFISKSRLAGFFAGTLFLVVLPNTDNLVRLSPQEPIQCFFLLFSLYLLFKYKNLFWSLVILLLAFLNKETTIALVPAISIYYLVKRFCGDKDNNLLKFVVGSILFSIVVIVIESSIRFGYSTHYTLNLLECLYRLKYYFGVLFSSTLLFLFFLTTFLFRLFYQIFCYGMKTIKKIEILQLFFLILLISFIAIQSPWEIIADRYLMLAIMAGVVFSGVEIGQFFNTINWISKPLSKVVFIVFLFFYMNFLVYNIVGTVKREMSFVHNTAELQLVLKYVSNNAPKNGSVFINFQKNSVTLEPLEEMNWQLALLYSRPDIIIKPISDKTPSDNNYLFINSTTITPELWPYGEIYEPTALNTKNLNKKDSVIQADSFLVLSNQVTIFRQTAKNVIGLIFMGKKLDLNGIYTYFQLKDKWNFYQYN